MIPGAEMKFSYKSIISWQFKMCLSLRTSFTCIKVHLLFYGSCSVTYSPLTVLSFLTGTSLLSEIIYSHHQILSPHCCTFSRWSANILNSMGFGIGHYGVNTLPQWKMDPIKKKSTFQLVHFDLYSYSCKSFSVLGQISWKAFGNWDRITFTRFPSFICFHFLCGALGDL